MFGIEQKLIRLGIKKEKVLFCYFEPERLDYTPLDIGHILAILKKNGLNKKYSFEIVPLRVFFSWEAEAAEKAIRIAADLILEKKPTRAFFFLDDMVSSLVRTVLRAEKITRLIKAKNPEIFIGFQSYKLDILHMRHLFSRREIDCIVEDDPERAFLFLDKIFQKKTVPGVRRGFSDLESKEGEKERRDRRAWKEALDELPSPYLSGILDDFLAQKAKETKKEFVCFLQTARGCPFGCHYCPRSVKFTQTRFFSTERFYDEMEYLVSRFGFFRFALIDDTFLFSKTRLLEFQKTFRERKIKNKRLESARLFVMMRVEILDEEVINILRELNVAEIQVGLQTINPQLQNYMNRQLELEKFKLMAAACKKNNIKLFLDIIGGLPGDSLEWFQKTVDFAVNLSPNRIQIKQLFLTPQTLFSKNKKELGIKTQKESQWFSEPYVISANGTGRDYHWKAYSWAESELKNHPEIEWSISSEAKSVQTPDFSRRF